MPSARISTKRCACTFSTRLQQRGLCLGPLLFLLQQRKPQQRPSLEGMDSGGQAANHELLHQAAASGMGEGKER